MELDQSATESKALLDNLRDAGCGLETTAQFMKLEKLCAHEEQIRLLSTHRRYLLDCLHKDEQRIDCLDYLLYQLQKRHTN